MLSGSGVRTLILKREISLQRPMSQICKIDKILRNEREVDISILLDDGNTKLFRYSDLDQVSVPEKQRSLRQIMRIKESSDVNTAIFSWKENYVLSVNVG